MTEVSIGPATLLRSVAVRRDLRGSGLGRRLTEIALELSRGLGAEETYLLTETARISSSLASGSASSRAPRCRAMVLDLRAE